MKKVIIFICHKVNQKSQGMVSAKSIFDELGIGPE